MTDREVPLAKEAWRVRDRVLSLSKPSVIGILNVTPDSFSDGGKYERTDRAVRHVASMLDQGADAIDVGGESTRPHGAKSVSVEEELRRVLPVVKAIRSTFPDAVLSVDTTKSDVAAAVLDAGAHAINDVSGLRIDPRMGQVVQTMGAGVVLMHSRGTVSEMATYRYAEYGEDVVDVVAAELRRTVDHASAFGIPHDAIVLDPGIGFSKRSEHSLRVLAGLRQIVALGFPVMVGVSRKRFIGELSGVQIAAQRVAGTIGANVMALAAGARIFRVHDVGPHRQALDVAWGVVELADNRDARIHRKSVFESRLPADRGRPPTPDSRR